MHKLEPLISTLDEALAQLRSCGKPHAFIVHGGIDSFGLTGGSLKHPVKVSLIRGTASGRNFGKYYCHDCFRLAVGDGMDRTLYALEDQEEYERIKLQLLRWCAAHQVPIRAFSPTTAPEYVEQYISEFIPEEWRKRLRLQVVPYKSKDMLMQLSARNAALDEAAKVAESLAEQRGHNSTLTGSLVLEADRQYGSAISANIRALKQPL